MPRRDPNKPPTFRGSDFRMRWEQSRWSEERIREAINRTGEFVAVPYGRSGIGPDDRDKAKVKEYWRRFVEVEGDWKRPDLLVVPAEVYAKKTAQWKTLGDDWTTLSDAELRDVLGDAVCGIEAENSLWVAERMPDFNSTLPLKRLNVVAPRIWVKGEDKQPLLDWQEHFDVPIFVVQVFFDRAYMIGLREVVAAVAELEALKGRELVLAQKTTGMCIDLQSYPDSRTGVGKKKLVYKAHHTVGTCFGICVETPAFAAAVQEEANGKLIPYVSFRGGTLEMTPEALSILRKLGTRGQL